MNAYASLCNQQFKHFLNFAWGFLANSRFGHGKFTNSSISLRVEKWLIFSHRVRFFSVHLFQFMFISSNSSDDCCVPNKNAIHQNVGWVDLGGELVEVCAQLRKFALVIILTRAGLEMDPKAFKRIYFTILKLGLVPWTAECVLCAVLSRYLLDLPWMWAFALGAIIAAVSPAVVVPCLFRLRTKGYGVAKGIPTLIVCAIRYAFRFCILISRNHKC